jgi:hypothetical protein
MHGMIAQEEPSNPKIVGKGPFNWSPALPWTAPQSPVEFLSSVAHSYPTALDLLPQGTSLATDVNTSILNSFFVYLLHLP